MAADRGRGWGECTEEQYRALDLEAHAILADVPLHDAWWVHLPTGDREGTMPEVRRVAKMAAETRSRVGVVPALFALRGFLGRIFGWDAAESGGQPLAGIGARVPARIRDASLVPAGSADGPFRVVYLLPDEAVSETRNATVEAYLVWAIRPERDGHRLTFAVHVLETGILTRPYMALIGPFRRWLVYPRLLSGLRDAWSRPAD